MVHGMIQSKEMKLIKFKEFKFISKIFIIRNKYAEKVLYIVTRFVFNETWKV